MKKVIIFYSIIFTIINTLFAQSLPGDKMNNFDNQLNIRDINGQSMLAKYIGVDGDPFFLIDYHYGNIELTTGRKFLNTRFRIELVNHELHFLTANAQAAFLRADYVKSCSFIDSTKSPYQTYLFRSDFPINEFFTQNHFCLVLSEGEVTLLKSINKKISSIKNELSGEMVKEFSSQEDYFVEHSGVIKRLKKDKAFILNLFSKKTTLLESFIKENKGSFKNEEYLVSIFNYYNGL
jgi:hypothetical protein